MLSGNYCANGIQDLYFPLTPHQAYKNNAKEKLNKIINKIFEEAKDFVSSKNLKIEFYIHKNHPFCDENNNVYASVVFLIKR